MSLVNISYKIDNQISMILGRVMEVKQDIK